MSSLADEIARNGGMTIEYEETKFTKEERINMFMNDWCNAIKAKPEHEVKDDTRG